MLFRASDVVVTGDVMDMTRFPMIDLANGGSIDGEIDALNRLIDLTIAPTPFIYKDVGTYVVPGHGRLSRADGSRGLSRHGGDRPRQRSRT